MPLLTIDNGIRSTMYSVPANIPLSEALLICGFPPETPCGGDGRCGKCNVTASGELSPITDAERRLLSEEDLKRGERLSCCAYVNGDVRVRLVTLPAGMICAEGVDPIVDPNPMFTRLGAAIDIGTTTLAAHLYDREGRLETITALNPQRFFGADVISRIMKASEGCGQQMASDLRNTIRDMLRELCEKSGEKTEDIDGVVITGNTAMLHLFTETDPKPLACAPFAVHELFGRFFSAEALCLPVAPQARVYLPRCISAFLGADLTTALLASGFCRDAATSLLMDIGTNGELALWHKGRLLCCSAAAGPAFEGASLSQGMRGVPGAIDHVRIHGGQMVLHTIGNIPARGICGSGAADLLACLVKKGLVDHDGLLDGGEPEWKLTGTVSMTQEDIRQLQLAKAAIRAGLDTLLAEAGIAADDVARLGVAGGFGSVLNLNSAARIGMLPKEIVPRSAAIGNAALTGAAMILRNTHLAEESASAAQCAETLDLAASPLFADAFIRRMQF